MTKTPSVARRSLVSGSNPPGARYGRYLTPAVHHDGGQRPLSEHLGTTGITSPLVKAEGHGWFLKRYDPAKALQFLAMVKSIDTLRVIPTDARYIEAATELMCRFSDQDLTLVDAVGLQAMDTRKTRVCWSTDRRLEITGAKLAIHVR